MRERERDLRKKEPQKGQEVRRSKTDRERRQKEIQMGQEKWRKRTEIKTERTEKMMRKEDTKRKTETFDGKKKRGERNKHYTLTSALFSLPPSLSPFLPSLPPTYHIAHTTWE